uniref:U1-type domain-containing protein n=1 Tax=Echinostoma caproni TaxID=27848 RepID=A0A183AW35_9TREM
LSNNLIRTVSNRPVDSSSVTQPIDNSSVQQPDDHEANLFSTTNPEECAQTPVEEIVRSSSNRLTQASHQLAAALISAPASNGLLFVTEANVKSRIPGHGVQMHEKLSARSRRRTTNSIQELEQKQTRARILRQQHLLERAERVHELSKKVEEVHMQKRLLLHQRRSCLERRLHAAERKRQAELERRVLKAHDEETKGREIAFIQTLEAEQKQHSILTKHEESQARLHELAAERRRRLEEKLCREEAAKGRRRALEASRRARLDALQARWESRAQQLASRAELLEHSRRAAARAKELHREVKIASLEEQQRTHIEQLRTKIQRKYFPMSYQAALYNPLLLNVPPTTTRDFTLFILQQEESERRHQEQLREISRKAFEMSILTHTADDSITAAGMEPYPIQKWCRACQVTIVSEVALKSHLQGKRHQNAVLEAGRNRPWDRSDVVSL